MVGYRYAANEMFLDDPFQHLRGTPPIPNTVRINHRNRTLLTQLQTVSLSTVDLTTLYQPKLVQTPFEEIPGLDAVVLFRTFRFGLVGAQKDVTLDFVDHQFIGFAFDELSAIGSSSFSGFGHEVSSSEQSLLAHLSLLFLSAIGAALLSVRDSVEFAQPGFEENIVIDIKQVRDETPGVGEVVHFNNAGAGLMPRCVLETQKDYLDLEATIGGYEAVERERARLDKVYDSIATLINCARDEVAVVENATVAWDMAFYAMTFASGDRILTAQAEYAANYIAYLQVAKRTGAVIEIIPSLDSGETSCEALERMLDERVKLISITHVPANGGLVNPAEEIGKIARAHGIPFLLDACQSVGQIPVDVQAIGCDMLSATGRKYLRGPRGTGFLYVRRSMLEHLDPPMIDLHAATWVAPDRYELRSDARRFENWESNMAAKVGLGVAVDYALSFGLEAIEMRLCRLAQELRERLAGLPGATVHDAGSRRCGIVSFSTENVAAAEIARTLRAASINTSVSSAASTLIDATRRNLPDMVRASLHYYNDSNEIERMMAMLTAMTGR